VLREFSVSGPISVAAAFVVDEDALPGAGAGAAPGAGASEDGSQQAMSVEKARARLAALEAAARAGGSVDMTQAQYEQRITKLQRDLTREWNASHREPMHEQRRARLRRAPECARGDRAQASTISCARALAPSHCLRADHKPPVSLPLPALHASFRQPTQA
jgi:hypothetical protein